MYDKLFLEKIYIAHQSGKNYIHILQNYMLFLAFYTRGQYCSLQWQRLFYQFKIYFFYIYIYCIIACLIQYILNSFSMLLFHILFLIVFLCFLHFCIVAMQLNRKHICVHIVVHIYCRRWINGFGLCLLPRFIEMYPLT